MTASWQVQFASTIKPSFLTATKLLVGKNLLIKNKFFILRVDAFGSGAVKVVP